MICTKSDLSVENNVFWSNMCFNNIYKSCTCSSRLSKNFKHQTSDVFRRLANSQSRQESVVTKLTKMSKYYSFTKFHHKQREIKSYSMSGNYLPRIGFHLDKRLVFPTRKRTRSVDSSEFKKNLGTMTFCIELIPNAHLYMRLIQSHSLSLWNPMYKDMTVMNLFTQHPKSHLLWWNKSANTQKDRFFKVYPNTTATIAITTNASKSNSGDDISKNQIYQWYWTAT